MFEGRVLDAAGAAGGRDGHVITAVSGSGAAKQAFNFATERVVGNGSFGVVFQATCLETAETVRARGGLLCVVLVFGVCVLSMCAAAAAAAKSEV
jgi:hypothetical protein